MVAARAAATLAAAARAATALAATALIAAALTAAALAAAAVSVASRLSRTRALAADAQPVRCADRLRCMCDAWVCRRSLLTSWLSSPHTVVRSAHTHTCRRLAPLPPH